MSGRDEHGLLITWIYNILSLDPASSIELVILYAALCVAHAGLRFNARKHGDGGVRQAYRNTVIHGEILACVMAVNCCCCCVGCKLRPFRSKLA